MEIHAIVIVEDDEDDLEMLKAALKLVGVKNELKCFDTAVKALEYLITTSEKIFMIISDINMPGMNGIEFKKSINADRKLHGQQIPFVFLTTAGDRYLKDSSVLAAQGYFEKPNNMKNITEMARAISTIGVNINYPGLIN